MLSERSGIVITMTTQSDHKNDYHSHVQPQNIIDFYTNLCTLK